MNNSLWGNDFIVEPTIDKQKKILKKIDNPKKIKDSTKILKSKITSIEEKLSLIQTEVNKILGVYKNDTIVIKTKSELIEYIDRAIINGVIAIDTETNNSLDPITCKIMGPCIYTPGMKNAYIPINHIDYKTENRLNWQLTEKDIHEQFSRLNGIQIITHNGKFDYEVLKCTTEWEMPYTWDTMLGARLLNENERAGLKDQYITKINPSIQHYSIDHLFENIEYAYVPPDIFALYAATDAFMTYRLYLYQKEIFERPENRKLYDLFLNVEIPVSFISAKMELTGICIDKDYSERLKAKYYKKLDDINFKIDLELKKYSKIIDTWRQTKEANYKPHKKSGEGFSKSKNEQLKNPIEVTSPTQLAILLYDIIKVPVVDKQSPRGTGEEILSQIDIPLCKLILEQRSILKLINAFIDALPKKCSIKDNRLHSHFNQLGTDTGRFSSTDPNLQQIPSRNKEIRKMFIATNEDKNVYISNNEIVIDRFSEIETQNGWVLASNLQKGDNIICYNDEINLNSIKTVEEIILDRDNYKIICKN